MLYAMLNGRGRTLHQTGQARLAAWALKTALMAENTQPLGGRAFPRHLYVHLYEAREPSEDLRIWLTTYTGDYAGVLHLYGLDLDDRQDGSRDERDIYGATVGMGPDRGRTSAPQVTPAILKAQGRSMTDGPTP